MFLLDKEEYYQYIQEYNNYKYINTYLEINDKETDQNKIFDVTENETKYVKNSLKDNLSIEEAIDEIEKTDIFKTTNDNNNPENIKITLKGNTIIYNNRIFIFNKNASKYKSALNRKIFYCQYHSHLINKLQKQKEKPFCSMKITYYPDNSEDKKFKITGEHTFECNNKYNENRSDKKKLLQDYETFQEKCYDEFNKTDFYNRKKFIEIAYNILNKYKLDCKMTENKIKNMIQKWKLNSQKFTKFLFLTDIKTFDDQNLLQNHSCKYFTYKNKRIFFEYYIWGNDFFINRCRLSNYIFIDGTFHVPPVFTETLIIMYYDNNIEKKIPAFYILMNSKTECAYNEIFKILKKF